MWFVEKDQYPLSALARGFCQGNLESGGSLVRPLSIIPRHSFIILARATCKRCTLFQRNPLFIIQCTVVSTMATIELGRLLQHINEYCKPNPQENQVKLMLYFDEARVRTERGVPNGNDMYDVLCSGIF